MEPRKKQYGPNLSMMEIHHRMDQIVSHLACSKEGEFQGMLAQELYTGDRPEPLPPKSYGLPRDSKGVIRCMSCGHKAGRKIVRLLKRGEGEGEVYVGPKKGELITGDARVRRYPNGPDKPAVFHTLRYWQWSPYPENQRIDEAFDRVMDRLAKKRRVVEIPNPRPVTLRPRYTIVSSRTAGQEVRNRDLFCGTDILMDGDKYILRYARGNGTYFYVAMNREIWKPEHIRHARMVLRASPISDLSALSESTREICAHLNLTYNSDAFVVSEDVDIIRGFQFRKPRDIPF